MTDINTATPGGCGYQDGSGLDPQVAAELGLSFPEAHFNPESMSAMALAIMKKNQAGLALLPFCCTVESEALGAKINLGNSSIGPRPGEFIHHSLDGFLAAGRELDLESGRLASILNACEILVGSGHKVSVEVSGPLSILSGLMELSQVVKAWRKNELLTYQSFERIGGQTIRYAQALKEAGVSIISYADPIAVPKIIGPKYSRALAESFLAKFLLKLKNELGGMAIHLCPNTARLLTDCELGQWHPISLRPGLSYQDGCLEVIGQADFLGQACLKRRNYTIPGGVIQEFKISQPAAA